MPQASMRDKDATLKGNEWKSASRMAPAHGTSLTASPSGPIWTLFILAHPIAHRNRCGRTTGPNHRPRPPAMGRTAI